MEANASSVFDPLMTVSQAWEGYRRSRQVDPVTLAGYESVFIQHVEPVLGAATVAAVDRDDVRRLLAIAAAQGLSPASVRLCRVVLGVACRHAVGLGVIDHLPTEGVPAPRSTPRPPRVMTPAEYLEIRDHLPTPGAQLLADVLVRAGLRVGEAVALMPEDVGETCITVRRALTEPGRRFSADGQRFVLRPSPKNGEERCVVVGERLVSRIRQWSSDRWVVEGELLFPGRFVMPEPSGRAFPQRLYVEPLTPERLTELGTFTGANGLTYQHGTMNGYVTGRCREACCRQAISEYSAARKRSRRLTEGLPLRRSAVLPPVVGEEGSVTRLDPVGPRDWGKLWRAAAEAADLEFVPLARQTRHAHASWLNSGGISVEGIAGRLGHRDERSTRCYVRPVGEESDPVAVLDALLGGTGSPPERG